MIQTKIPKCISRIIQTCNWVDGLPLLYTWCDNAHVMSNVNFEITVIAGSVAGSSLPPVQHCLLLFPFQPFPWVRVCLSIAKKWELLQTRIQPQDLLWLCKQVAHGSCTPRSHLASLLKNSGTRDFSSKCPFTSLRQHFCRNLKLFYGRKVGACKYH